jgi:hypothetical protein
VGHPCHQCAIGAPLERDLVCTFPGTVVPGRRPGQGQLC